VPASTLLCIASLAGLGVPFRCAETHELGEEIVASYLYLGREAPNPQSVEWPDESGELLYAAYYEYEIEANRNWTRRVIWVWSRQSPIGPGSLE
jgi:hypothetical protein